METNTHSPFLVASYDKKQKRQRIVVIILLALFFILSSFTFFNLLYCFVECIGAIVSGSMDVALSDFLRTVPVFLTFFMTLWGLLLVHASYRKVSEEKWRKSIFKDAICIIVFGVINIVYILVNHIAGRYLSLVEGSPSALFPLDALLYSVLFICLGVLVVLYVKKFEAKHPYVVPARGPVVTKARGLYCTFVTFWMLFALYGFIAGILSFFIYDFKHEHVFFGIATILVFLLSAVQIIVWELYFNELTEEGKKAKLLRLAIVSLIASVVIAFLYFLSLGMDLDAPSNAGFGMFPIAFAASVNIATLLAVACPVIVSIVALIKGILLKKK